MQSLSAPVSFRKCTWSYFLGTEIRHICRYWFLSFVRGSELLLGRRESKIQKIIYSNFIQLAKSVLSLAIFDFPIFFSRNLSSCSVLLRERLCASFVYTHTPCLLTYADSLENQASTDYKRKVAYTKFLLDLWFLFSLIAPIRSQQLGRGKKVN